MTIPLDKRLHFIVGLFLALPLAVMGWPFEGIALAAVVGALKEVWDRFHPLTHTADFFDFAATVFGGMAGAGIGWLL